MNFNVFKYRAIFYSVIVFYHVKKKKLDTFRYRYVTCNLQNTN